MKKRYLLGTLILLALLVAGCSKTASEKLILTTTNTYYEPVKAIVGDKYKVESIIKSANVDPHDYKPTTAVSQKAAKAALVVSNGVGYDDWINKIVEANNKQDLLLNNGADVLHLKNGANEHIWFDVPKMKQFTKVLYQRVSEMDKLNKQYYKKNYQAYDKKLDKLIQKEKNIKQHSSGMKAYVTEPLPNYLLKDLGVKVQNERFAKAIEDGTDPSIKDVQKIQDGLKNHSVDFIVVNKQVSSNIVNKLKNTAKENNVPIVYLTETLPKNASYFQMINDSLNQIAKIVE